MGPIGEAI